MPNCVACAATPAPRRPRRPRATRPAARRSCARPRRSSRRRSTVSSWSPIRIRAPSRSATGPVTRRAVDERAVARARRPRSGRRAVAGRDARVRARDARVVELQRRARRAPDHQVARRAARARRRPAPARAARRRRRAARRSCRRTQPRASPGGGSPGTARLRAYSADSGWNAGLSPLSLSDCWSLRVVDRQPDAARRCPTPRQSSACGRPRAPARPAARSPCRRARRAACAFGEQEVVAAWRGAAPCGPFAPSATTASCLPSGENAASSTPSPGFGRVGDEVLPSPVVRVGRERLLRLSSAPCRTRRAGR